jgi:hypothetical protein
VGNAFAGGIPHAEVELRVGVSALGFLTEWPYLVALLRAGGRLVSHERQGDARRDECALPGEEARRACLQEAHVAPVCLFVT